MYRNSSGGQGGGGQRRSGGQGGRRRFFTQKKNFRGARIDVSKFINKSTVVAPEEKYVAKHLFKDFFIADALKANIASKGYTAPTPIQDQAIPPALEGKDIVGIAQTGTGKTGAFLIPLINKVLKFRKEKVLILAPTRELALQIQDEFYIFAKGFNMHSTLCIGGANIGAQIRNIKRNPNFVIGTPGRLKDLISRRLLDLSTFHNLVVDEADRMVDMGFIHDLKFLLSHMSEDRQSLFFSATISPQIAELIKKFLKDPVSVSVKSRETSANVDQDVIHYTTKEDKLRILQGLLVQEDFNKVIIFGQTKFGVEKLCVNLNKLGFKAESIHGDKSQSRRQRALDMFQKNQIQILVATDVAARGLDIDNVSHVINYDLPPTYEDYVHRIGRTGRANQKGFALTFVEGKAAPTFLQERR